jgi:hypothetical protein
MTKLPLGQLEPVDLRHYWKDESRDFTPWLADEQNIALLGRVIGLQLEVEQREKNVGPFFADILCRDVSSGTWVVIENQLERTDHSHLGQILTYAAGLEAKAIIWVASKFTDEHRAALDWLNEITSEDFGFFGVEVELWRIGDSPPAPKFNLVCQPNDWSRAVQASAAHFSAGEQLQLEFWTGFKGFLEGRSSIRCPKPHAQSWMSHSIGLRGCHLDSVFSSFDSMSGKAGGEIRVDVYLDGAGAKQLFAALEAQRTEVERELGEPMTWYSPENRRMSRIYVRRVAEISDRSQWPSYYAWLKEKLEALTKIFVPRVQALPR